MWSLGVPVLPSPCHCIFSAFFLHSCQEQGPPSVANWGQWGHVTVCIIYIIAHPHPLCVYPHLLCRASRVPATPWLTSTRPTSPLPATTSSLPLLRTHSRCRQAHQGHASVFTHIFYLLPCTVCCYWESKAQEMACGRCSFPMMSCVCCRCCQVLPSGHVLPLLLGPSQWPCGGCLAGLMQTTSPPIVLMPLLLLLLPGPSQRAGSQVPQPVLDRRGLALPLHALLPDTGWVSGVPWCVRPPGYWVDIRGPQLGTSGPR